jgi:tetratricopeptide (TPR) repeat protein
MAAQISVSLVFILSLLLSLVSRSQAEDCNAAARLAEEAKQFIDSRPLLAEQKLQGAVDYCSRSATLRHNLGVVLYLHGKNDEAVSKFEEALKLKSDYGKAMNSLAALTYMNNRGDYDRALNLAAKAVELEPKNKHFKDTLNTITSYIDMPPVTNVNKPDAVAVIIGNKTYRNSSIPNVDYADRDAEVISRYLIETLGFSESNVIRILDASYTDFLRIFGDANEYRGTLYSRVKSGLSDVFVFYSGHGVPDTNTKKALIAPVDVDPSAVKLTSYPLDLLYDNLAKLNQEKNLKSLVVVIDACFSGAYNNGMIISNASPITLEVSSPYLQLKDAVLFTSASGSQISSWYPAQQHGLFTYFFLKTIKKAAISGKPLTSGDLEKELLGPESVNDYAWRIYSREQTPQVVGNKSLMLLSTQNTLDKIKEPLP